MSATALQSTCLVLGVLSVISTLACCYITAKYCDEKQKSDHWYRDYCEMRNKYDGKNEVIDRLMDRAINAEIKAHQLAQQPTPESEESK